MTKIGRPSRTGQNYMIRYENPQLRFARHMFYRPIIVPGLMYYIPEKKKVRYLFENEKKKKILIGISYFLFFMYLEKLLVKGL